jgi:hypothetical protein
MYSDQCKNTHDDNLSRFDSSLGLGPNNVKVLAVRDRESNEGGKSYVAAGKMKQLTAGDWSLKLKRAQTVITTMDIELEKTILVLIPKLLSYWI